MTWFIRVILPVLVFPAAELIVWVLVKAGGKP
jgi:hypothetical protein